MRKLTVSEMILSGIILLLALCLISREMAKNPQVQTFSNIPIIVKIADGKSYQCYLQLKNDNTVTWLLGPEVAVPQENKK